jgi:hypothetical protein
MSTTRAWNGHGDNDASNSGNWSPGGVPQPGDDLVITHGTMNVCGSALAGDTLSVAAPFGAPPIEIDTLAGARLDLHSSLAGGLFTRVDVNVHGTVTLTADVVGLSQLNISGGTIHFIGSSTFTGLNQVFNDRLVGTGMVKLRSATHLQERMEINGAVGRGLTFDLASAGPPLTALQIDDPGQFHGHIIIGSEPPAPAGFGDVAFMGLHATSADLRNDMLLMFDGHKLVDAVRISGGGSGLKLEQNSLGVMLSKGGGAYYQPGGVGIAIPLHFS